MELFSQSAVMEKLFTALLSSVAIVTLFTVWGFWRTGQIPVYPRISGIAVIKVEETDPRDLAKRSVDARTKHRRKILDSEMRSDSSLSRSANRPGKQRDDSSKRKKGEKLENFPGNVSRRKIDRKLTWPRENHADRKRKRMENTDLRMGKNVPKNGTKFPANDKRALHNGAKVLGNANKTPNNGTKVLGNGTKVPTNDSKVPSHGKKVPNKGTKVVTDDGDSDRSGPKQDFWDSARKMLSLRKLHENLYNNSGDQPQLKRLPGRDGREGINGPTIVPSRLKQSKWTLLPASRRTSGLQSNKRYRKLVKKRLSAKKRLSTALYAKNERHYTSTTPSNVPSSTSHSVSLRGHNSLSSRDGSSESKAPYLDSTSLPSNRELFKALTSRKPVTSDVKVTVTLESPVRSSLGVTDGSQRQMLGLRYIGHHEKEQAVDKTPSDVQYVLTFSRDKRRKPQS